MNGVEFLSLLTLLSNVFLVILVLSWSIDRFLNINSLWSLILNTVKNKWMLLSFLVAFTALTGSLYFSEVSGFTPCKLCWFQRILMYPLTFILGVALLASDKKVWRYVLPLSISGTALAFYHYYLQRAANPLSPCSTIGFSVSCSDRFFMHYGYITIPWMAFSAFALISAFMLILKSK